MDAERNHSQSSMTRGGKRHGDSGRGLGDRVSLGGGQERHPSRILHKMRTRQFPKGSKSGSTC